ncbi:hypothetical protein [Leptospira haakeii]|uniref:Lipoprotein n=1 Tax=Leptospira haakeii TaxID=2023198 RepID=A0ABX4PQ95_9LEPT|nr:hypothetical protein [Leptospira haakeii]PKA17976.1 hypothetical protein CH363_04970 [Leptospira haakeii]PKA21701.1 hypothetical protein CH377_04970 [Leptospira haakeii]
MKVRNLVFCLILIFGFISCGIDPVERCQDRRKVMRDAVCQAVGAHQPGTESYNNILLSCLMENNHYNECKSEDYF